MARPSGRATLPRDGFPAPKEIGSFRVMAETEGFEPSIPVTRYGSLAGSWFQPLTHVSACRNEEAFTARGAL